MAEFITVVCIMATMLFITITSFNAGERSAYREAAIAHCNGVCEAEWRVIDKSDNNPAKWSCKCALISPEKR